MYWIDFLHKGWKLGKDILTKFFILSFWGHKDPNLGLEWGFLSFVGNWDMISVSNFVQGVTAVWRLELALKNWFIGEENIMPFT